MLKYCSLEYGIKHEMAWFKRLGNVWVDKPLKSSVVLVGYQSEFSNSINSQADPQKSNAIV